MNTQSVENYVKCIYSLSNGNQEGVSTNAIAEKLETKASSVTDMLKKLSIKGLVVYTPYKATFLTDAGVKVAVSIIRKHRLWEVFLLQKLAFKWDEVHDIAEQLEHIHSDELTNRLDEFLGFPQVDPHGDAIPDESGEFRIGEEKLLLSELSAHEVGRVTGVVDSSTEFLHFLEKHRLLIGANIKVKELLNFDHSIIVEMSGQNMTLSKYVTDNLYVKRIQAT